ncbi:hypothetical protein [Streptomyces sp. NBC_01257]|uniref:hypothetical protein n=1 Tax=Streptomyces sp. NBC_01257 TaxID=2903799 RepID=UPI002DD9E314|nr:hypothetical protein [Streptomyces sp. NBC_01257]WRZ65809.1 hypothetical protein OG408_18840 [Streptomyces sp. NBC_01257]
MASEVWTSVLSLTGVALGGGLTALSQRATQRSADRAEERRLREHLDERKAAFMSAARAALSALSGQAS